MERCAGSIIPVPFVPWRRGPSSLCSVLEEIFAVLVTFYFVTIHQSKVQSYAGVYRCRDTQRYTFATEFISVVLQNLPWNRRRKLEELKWVTNKLFLVNWWGISVGQGMWWSLYELSQQKQIHPLLAKVSQVHLSSLDPCYHRQNRVMKWLLGL